MKYEAMIIEVIKRYGFENEKTIGFCELAEKAEKNPQVYESQLFTTYKEIME